MTPIEISEPQYDHADKEGLMGRSNGGTSIISGGSGLMFSKDLGLPTRPKSGNEIAANAAVCIHALIASNTSLPSVFIVMICLPSYN
jgi:hypothetical protein